VTLAPHCPGSPRTGEALDDLLPGSINMRRVFVDTSSTPVTFWVGSHHGAAIIRLEPLDWRWLELPRHHRACSGDLDDRGKAVPNRSGWPGQARP
jgi:hypothetical protein